MYKISKDIKIGKTVNQIEIIPTGDWHLGSVNCNRRKLKEYLEYIRITPNCYLIGMGDLVDCILPKDKRYDASGDFRNLDELKQETLELLKPIRDKIIVLLTGNHEIKLQKEGYGDPIKWLCSELKVPYGGFSCFIKIHAIPDTHRKSLIIFAHHGFFSGRKRGSKINNIEDLSAYWDADIFLAGHSHDIFSSRKVKIGWAGSRDLLFINTGSFVETASWRTSNYSEIHGFPPQRLGVVKVKWYPRTGRFYGTD